MRTCVACGKPIVGQAVLNPKVNGPCCSAACAHQAEKTHPATLTPGQIGRLAYLHMLDLLTPEEWAEVQARRTPTSDSEPEPEPEPEP